MLYKKSLCLGLRQTPPLATLTFLVINSLPQSLYQVSLRRFFPPSLRSRSLSSFFPPSLRSGSLSSFFFSVSVSVSFFSFFDRILLTIFRFKVWLGLHFKEALATYLVCNLLFNNALQKAPVSRAQTNPTPSHTYARCVYL